MYNDFLLVNPFCRFFRQFWLARVGLRAAAFWILCSLFGWLLGNPYSRLLQKSKRLVTKAFTRIFVHSKLRNFLILLMLYKWKSAVLRMLFIWVSILSCPSNQQPRFLTLLAGVMLLSPTCMESMLTLASCCLFPMIMNSVLSSFSLSLSWSIQFLMSAVQFCIADKAADCSALESALKDIYNCVSSA